MAQFHVSRSEVIDAAPERVFEVIADYGTWTQWSPWLCADAHAKVSVSADASAVGSIYGWKGELVGEGEIEHRRLQPGRLIEDEIRFAKPFKSKSQVSFDLEDQEGKSKVTWHMHGSLPWFLFWMRSKMEIFIGMDYERGLRMLKEWTETGRVLSKTEIVGIETVGPLRMAGVRHESATAEMGPKMDAAFAEVAQELERSGVPRGREAISVYHRFDLKSQTFDFTAGYVLCEHQADLPAGLATWSLPASRALRVHHVGSYRHLGNAWSAAHQYARYKKLKLAKTACFELYKNDPHATEPADLVTEIYLPLR